MQIPRSQALGEQRHRLRRQEDEGGQSHPRHLTAKHALTGTASHEEEPDPRLSPFFKQARRLQNRPEVMGPPEVARILHDEHPLEPMALPEIIVFTRHRHDVILDPRIGHHPDPFIRDPPRLHMPDHAPPDSQR